MPAQEINEYYRATKNREIRPDLLFALENIVDTNAETKVAIDCGCGAGADIEYLLSKGYEIHGFDSEPLAIETCHQRFNESPKVHLTIDTFRTFSYPQSSLVLADASLFFCPARDFTSVWKKITQCLSTHGIFCGSFLGPDDTAAEKSNHSSNLWPNALAMSEDEVKSLFESDYEILRFTEHKSSGTDFSGKLHNWHIFSVVAKNIE